jgi:WD40 repeat protein
VIDSCTRGLATAGNDGKVKLWTANAKLVATFDLQFCDTSDKRICSVKWSTDGRKVRMETYVSRILSFVADDAKMLTLSMLFSNHFLREITK